MDGGGSSGGGAPVRSRGASLTPSSPSISTASASTSSFKNRLISNPRPPSSPFSDNDTATDEDPMDEEDDFEDIATTAVANNSNSNADELDIRSSSMRTFNSARFSDAKNNKKSEVKVEAEVEMPTGVVVKDEGTKGILTESVQASGAYSAREEGLKREESAGRLKFTCCANDGVDEHMIWLIGLKNIFSRQLPNMPKEYIVRLVMDTTHKSMMVIRNNQVVGGITYRPYISQKFGEIAFCAITSDEQVKGYGTRLMNYLKQHARDVDGLTHFLTYADNNAVGYFVKQGFTKEITLDKERWYGYIKDYDGGILMECKINPKLPYTDLSTMIRRQRQAIDEKIRELSNCHIVYPGIDFQKKEAGIPRKPIKVEDIPGLKEAGWTPDQYGHSRYKAATVTDSAAYREQLNDFMRALLKAMNDHPDAWPFREPVDARDVPDYYDVIKDPMDLKTMAKRLESEQYYITFEMFFADVKRMLSNARTYNSPETIYYKCATRLENFFTNKVQNQLNHANQSNLKNTISIADF